MDEKHIKYQSLSLQEAKAMEREVVGMIQYAFLLGRQVEAETRDAAIMHLEPVTDSTH